MVALLDRIGWRLLDSQVHVESQTHHTRMDLLARGRNRDYVVIELKTRGIQMKELPSRYYKATGKTHAGIANSLHQKDRKQALLTTAMFVGSVYKGSIVSHALTYIALSLRDGVKLLRVHD